MILFKGGQGMNKEKGDKHKKYHHTIKNNGVGGGGIKTFNR